MIDPTLDLTFWAALAIGAGCLALLARRRVHAAGWVVVENVALVVLVITAARWV